MGDSIEKTKNVSLMFWQGHFVRSDNLRKGDGAYGDLSLFG